MVTFSPALIGLLARMRISDPSATHKAEGSQLWFLNDEKVSQCLLRIYEMEAGEIIVEAVFSRLFILGKARTYKSVKNGSKTSPTTANGPNFRMKDRDFLKAGAWIFHRDMSI